MGLTSSIAAKISSFVASVGSKNGVKMMMQQWISPWLGFADFEDNIDSCDG